jgi:hypothetical protein
MTSIRSFINRLFDKHLYITIVSGLPRSGTSMMMSALKAGGMKLLVDGRRRADENNPKGYYEYELVKQLPKRAHRWLGSAQGKALKVVSALLVYLPEHYRYRVIFVEREMAEILASQKRMLERTGKAGQDPVSDEDLWSSYLAHLAEVKSWLNNQDWLRTLYISYNHILDNPEQAFLHVANFLDHRVDPEAMAQIVDRSLYREKK